MNQRLSENCSEIGFGCGVPYNRSMADYLATRIDFDDPRLSSVIDEVSYWSSHFGRLLLQNIELKPGITALDLACGGGFPLLELAQVHGKTCCFVGADIWESALKRALLKRQFYGLSRLFLVRTDGARLPFPANTFDLITSNLGINNFDNATAVFGECSRVMKNKGRIILTSNIKGHMKEFYDVYRGVLKDLGMNESLERLQANEAHRSTVESICRALEQFEFRIVKTLEEPFTMRYLDAGALFKHALTRIGFLDAWRAVVDVADEQRTFHELERRLNNIAKEKGEFRVTVPMLYVEGIK